MEVKKNGVKMAKELFPASDFRLRASDNCK